MRLYGIFSLMLLAGCSSTVTVSEKIPLPEVPEYVKVPHPAGFELADLKAIFFSPLAPKGVLGEFGDTCDDEFKKLSQLTTSKDDIRKGAVELVTQDPERMHWCFYAKISKLQDTIQGDTTWNTRQKKVLDTFGFLGPIANAYVDVYKDSRYLRWAALYYSKISEWVFFKKVNPTPDSTLNFVQNSRSDLEPWVQVQKTNGQVTTTSVFSKYGISLAPTIAGSGQVNPLNSNITQNPETTQDPAVTTPVTAPATAEAVPTEDPSRAPASATKAVPAPAAVTPDVAPDL